MILAALAAFVAGHAQTPSQTTVQPAPTWDFVHPADKFSSSALLDLRYLNEKVAGESGFVHLSSDGGGFVLGNGKPVRFWCVVSDAYRLPPAQMAEHARFLAKLGVNMVRLHTQLAPKDKSAPFDHADQKEIEGIWRCVAALKKEGIYTTISPYWAADKEAENWGIDGYGHEGLWGLLFFNARLQDAYRSWVKALFEPTNPYTGIPLAKDPSVAIIQVQNEDSLLFWTTQGIKPAQQAVLGRKFGQWLVAKYGSLDSAKKAWDNVGTDHDQFAQGIVGLFDMWHLTQPWTGGLAQRVDDQCEFYAETQRKFYADMGDYFRNTLGCAQLLNASNWITADPIRLNDIERWTYTPLDVLAVNKYTGGVHVGPNDGWRVDPGDHYTADSCLLDPRALPTNLKQVRGHPIVITESTWVTPELYQAEGPFLAAAYESLTGVAGFYFFAAGDTPEYDPDPYFNFVNVNGQHALQKWTCATPMLMGMFPANALMYRMGYLKASEPVVSEFRPVASLWSRAAPIIAEDRTFDPNRDTGDSRGQSNLAHGVDPLAFLVGKVQVQYAGLGSMDTAADMTKYIDHADKLIRSSTGEVGLDYGRGVCIVDSPKAQGVCGFIRGEEEQMADVSISSGDRYAAIEAVSMDDQPLASSHRVLVQVGTTARPTGWQDKPSQFKGSDGKTAYTGFEVLNTGHMPWQVVGTDTALSIANTVLTKATLLDASGYAAGDVPIGHKDGRLIVKLPPNAMYVILSD